MTNILIIGAGPAGVSAALYTARSGVETTILHHGVSALQKAARIENYYGFPGGVGGGELFDAGIRAARELGIPVVSEEAVGISYDGRFRVRTDRTEHTADALLLATGAARKTPDIPGLSTLEGSGVSYCAVCDAFFYRKKAVAILGSGEYALHEAEVLLPLAESVTLLQNGRSLTAAFPETVRVDSRPIARVLGKERVEGVVFSDGESLALDGIFVAEGTADSAAFARTLGLAAVRGRLVVDGEMQTNLPGLFAAGDCVGGLLQVSKAVADGAAAGLAMVRFLKSRQKQEK